MGKMGCRYFTCKAGHGMMLRQIDGVELLMASDLRPNIGDHTIRICTLCAGTVNAGMVIKGVVTRGMVTKGMVTN